MHHYLAHERSAPRGRNTPGTRDDIRVGAAILIAAVVLAVAFVVAARGLWLLLGPN